MAEHANLRVLPKPIHDSENLLCFVADEMTTEFEGAAVKKFAIGFVGAAASFLHVAVN